MSSASRQKKILLVEDEALIAMAEAMTLTNFGYEVITAYRGEEAVRLACSESVDLILMDINLGRGMDGTQAAREILRQREAPIIFLSAHYEKEMVSRVRNITRYGYIIKNSGDFVLQSSIEMAFELFEAHQRTRDSEKRYQTLAETVPVGVFHSDASGDFTYVNERWQQITGIGPQQALGQGWKANLYLADRQQVIDEWTRAVLEARSFSLEYRYQHHGAITWVLGQSSVEKDKDGEVAGFVGTITDISERKQADAELLRGKEKIDSIFRAAPIGIGMEVNRVIKEANDMFCTITGYTRQELIDQSAHLLYPSDEVYAFVGEEKYRQIASGGGGSMEARLRRKDGKVIDILLSSAPQDPQNLSAGVTFTVLDITERKQAEQALRRREQEYMALAEHIPDMVARFDSQYRHIYVNPAVVQELGHSVEQVVGKTHRELGQPPDMADWSEGIIRQVFKSGREVAFELNYPTNQGIKTYLSKGVPEFAPDGTVSTALFIHRNITDYKQAQQALTESELRFRTIYEQSPIGIELFDASGALIGANPACLEIFGVVELQDIMGLQLFDDPSLSGEQKTMLRGGQTARYQVIFDFSRLKTLKLYHTWREGTAWLDVLITPLGDTPQTTGGYLLQVQDLSERRQAEVTLSASEKES